MATTEEPLALESGQADIAERPLGVMTRPQGGNGWRDWLSTVDHKKIGIMYGIAAMFFFIVGGIEALLLRTQLAFPEQGLLSPQLYNELFTMHGVTMVFLFIMPLAAADRAGCLKSAVMRHPSCLSTVKWWAVWSMNA